MSASPATGALGGKACLGRSLVRPLVQRLDRRAEQLRLAAEVMIDRLPGQAGGFGDLVHRRAPVTGLGEHFHGGVQNSLA